MIAAALSAIATLAWVFGPIAFACRRDIAEAWRDFTRPLP